MWLYFRFSSERVNLNCLTHSVKFEYLYLRKLSMIRNKVVWDKHYYSNRFTVRNIFLLCYSRFRLICIFKVAARISLTMFQNFDLVSGLSVLILDFSDKKTISFKVYNVTRKFYEYSDYTPTFSSCNTMYFLHVVYCKSWTWSVKLYLKLTWKAINHWRRQPYFILANLFWNRVLARCMSCLISFAWAYKSCADSESSVNYKM